MQKGEQLAAALKRMDQVANLVDIDLSQFSNSKENEDDNVEAKEELVLDGVKNTSEEEE